MKSGKVVTMTPEGSLRLLAYQQAYWPQFGGHAHHLRSRLPLLRRYGIEPWVLTPRFGDSKETEVVDDVLVRRIRIPGPMRSRLIKTEMALFPEFVRRRSEYDLALLSSANVAGAFIRDICGKPVIRESVIGENHAEKFKRGLGGKAREFVFRRIDFATVVSPALEQAYVDVSWPRPRMSLIPYGVDTEAFRPAESNAEIEGLRRSLELPGRPSPLFLSVGAIQTRKGHLDLVEAWSSLPAEGPQEHLIIVGPVNDESYFLMLKRRVTELGLEGQIHFQGRSDRIADYMRCVDGFVFASHNEGLPISVIEAMSSGLPVAAFDIDGIFRFLLDDGKNGIIVSGRDREALSRAVRTLSTEPGRRAQLGLAARATVMERFSLEREAEAHAELYWAVFRENQSGARS